MPRIVMFVGRCCAFFGLAALPYQFYLWVRHGEWTAFSPLGELKKLDRHYHWPWLWYPTDWIGLHQLLDATPLSLFLILVAIPIFCAGYLLAGWEEEKNQRREEALISEVNNFMQMRRTESRDLDQEIEAKEKKQE